MPVCRDQNRAYGDICSQNRDNAKAAPVRTARVRRVVASMIYACPTPKALWDVSLTPRHQRPPALHLPDPFRGYLFRCPAH